MTAERWAKVKAVFAEALEAPAGQREAYLREQCAGDPDLEEQVRSLLASHEEAEQKNSFEQANGSQKHVVGPYLLTEMIGAGGMGEVYRAMDQRLERIVALKILLPEFAGNPEFVKRFHREARAVSAIEHPNICRLYDIGEHEGRPYFTMELIEGVTLRQRLQQGPIAFREVVRIGTEIAAALQVAHSRGFLHRDIKPGNIFLANDGNVKVVDFGLAKPLVAGDSTSLTNSRVIPGTPSYMSPEQALGEGLDARSDLFSLGVVLYELATGRSPFVGESPAVTLDHVLHQTPAFPSALNPEIPPEFDTLIFRLVAKKREERFGNAAELQQSLRRLLEPPLAKRVAKSRKPLVFAAAGVLVLIGVISQYPRLQPVVEAPLKIAPLDTSPGPKEAPVFAPSGDRIAYSASQRQGESHDIYVKLLGAGTALRVTTNSAHDMQPVFSPDGKYIAFRRTRDAEPSFYIAPSLGGGETRILRSYGNGALMGGRDLDWAPDGKSLIIADRLGPNEPRALLHVLLDSREIKTLRKGTPFVAYPVFSPDGKRLAFACGPSALAQDICVMDMPSGEPLRVTNDNRWLAGITWTADGKELVFSSNRGGLFALWRVASSGGTPRPVTGTGPDAYSPYVSRNGKGLIYLHRSINVNLWRAPLDGGESRRLIESGRSSTQAAYSPDNQRIAFSSDRSGSWEIWVADADGSNAGKLTSMNAGQSGSPRWSPDGRKIAFDARPEGQADIYVVSAEGGEPVRLTTEPADDFFPAWSHDGEHIYFSSNRSGSREIWRMPAAGGTAVRITPNGGNFPVTSSDGKWLYYSNESSLYRLPIPEGAPERVIEAIRWLDFAFVPQGILFVRPEMGPIQEIDIFAQGRRHTVLKGIGPRPSNMGPLTASSDGKWLLYDRVDQNFSEIRLAENFR